MHTTTLSRHDIDRLAQRRAAARMGWLIHATVFLAVNGGLAALALITGRHGPGVPALGWALGLTMHGLAVLVLPAGAGLYQRLVQHERARLERRMDPW